MSGAIPPLSQYASWRGAQLNYRHNFTFSGNLIVCFRITKTFYRIPTGNNLYFIFVLSPAFFMVGGGGGRAVHPTNITFFLPNTLAQEKLKISFEGIGIPDSLYRSDICVMNVN
jgi:hypothetical protein